MKKWVRHDNPDKYLSEHVLKGDAGDGVPNVLMNDNCLVVGDRQRPMTKKKLADYSNPENMPEDVLRNYERNRLMIDLGQIPQEYKDQIMDEYRKDKEVGREQLFNYFIKQKLKNLLTDIQDF